MDNPARAALLGPHAHFAERRGQVLRYPVDVSPFVALPDVPDEQTWRDAVELLGVGGVVPLAAVDTLPPPGWDLVLDLHGVQMVAVEPDPAPDPEAVRLGPADVPEMLDLVARTKPGPFLPRTIEMGTYLGIRRGGVLVAMAGERLHPPGWTEISAVCTDDGWRGRGFGARLVRAVAHGITARGETPFLHTGATNAGAIRLYERLGFRIRRPVHFRAARIPALHLSEQ